MTDFDFDELDKAVNGALTAPADSDSGDSNNVIVSRETVPQRPAAPAVRRSAGRFMDMVHPASDMRSNRSSVAPRPTETPAPAPNETVSPVTPPSISTPEPVPAPPVSSMEFEEIADTSARDTQLSEIELPEQQKPLESPFLPDAKVEKRPLGGTNTPSLQDAQTPEAEVSGEELLLEAPADPQLQAHNDVTTPEAAVPAFPQTAKKKSHIGTIIWIIALILIGVGVGAAVYIYVLPLL